MYGYGTPSYIANFIFVESITLNKLMIKICYFKDHVEWVLTIINKDNDRRVGTSPLQCPMVQFFTPMAPSQTTDEWS